MFIDPHTHSKPSSWCGLVTVKELIDLKKSAGYDGVVLTNHVTPSYYSKDFTYEMHIKRMIEEYKEGKEYADSIGFTFLFGCEISLYKPAYADFLLFGVTENFFWKCPNVNDLSIKELYEICQKENILIYQAHPFRGRITIADYHFVDGYEINVCKQRDFDYKDRVIEYAEKHNKPLICGCDFHGYQTLKNGGLVFSSKIKSTDDLVRSLKSNDYLIKY